jgi:hypothetical protein
MRFSIYLCWFHLLAVTASVSRYMDTSIVGDSRDTLDIWFGLTERFNRFPDDLITDRIGCCVVPCLAASCRCIPFT